MIFCLLVARAVCPAQPDFMRQARQVGPAPTDPAIVRALGLIDPSHIDQTTNSLVGYDTRNSLSSMEQMPAGKVIDAAADWIVAEFDRISKRCEGSLEVKRDTFVADPASAAGSPWANRSM
jgi:hypothetical protein